MDGVKRTAAEERAHIELLVQLAAQEAWLAAFWAGGGRPAPLGAARSNAAECELEIDLDADVVKWFRALGPRHLARMNAVLRIYAEETGRRG